MRIIGLLTVVLIASLAAFGQMTIEPSDPYPDPDSEVTLRLVNAPSGATFRWTLGTTGVIEGAGTSQRWRVPEGFHEIRVEALQSDRVIAVAHLGLLVDAYVGAFRTARVRGSAVDVTVLIYAKTHILGAGLMESIPAGVSHSWDVQSGQSIGSPVRDGNELYWLWSEIPAGSQVMVRYTLHLDPQADSIRLDGEASGIMTRWRGARVGGQLRAP